VIKALERAGLNIGVSTAICLAEKTFPCIDICLPSPTVPGVSLGCQLCVARGLLSCGISETGDAARQIAAALRACF
jgi:hypothetical protein